MTRIPPLRKRQDGDDRPTITVVPAASRRFFAALRITGISEAPQARVADTDLTVLPDDDTWLVPLPGWIMVSGAAVVVTTPDQDGRTEVAPDTDLLVSWLEEFASGAHDDKSGYALVNALEFIHCGGLWSHLSEAAHDWLLAAAPLAGLAHLAPSPTHRETPEEELSPTVRTLLRRLGRAVRAVGPFSAAGFLADLVDEFSPDNGDRHTLVKTLTPRFCETGATEALYAILLPDEGPAAIVPDFERPWDLSVCLPARLLCEDYAGVQDILRFLAEKPEVYTSTPAVAWVMQRLVTRSDPFVPQHLFEGIIRAGLALVNNRASLRRGGVGCVHLRRAILRLLEQRHLLSDSVQTILSETVVHAYGLAPGFWDLARDPSLNLPAELDACNSAFAHLSSSLGASEAQRHAALRPFRDWGTAGASRTGRELLGPFGIGHWPALPLPRLGQSGAELGESLLRGYAAPCAPDPDPACAALLAQATRRAFGDLPVTGTEDLQRMVLQSGLALLDTARSQPDDPDAEHLTPLGDGLTRLAGLASGCHGLALTLALVQDLHRRGAPLWAEALAQRMAPVLERVLRNGGEEVLRAPALCTAADRLAAADVTQPQTQRLLAALKPEEPRDAGRFAHDLPARWEDSLALWDTLVVVYSCQANLETRIPALRDTWLKDLSRLGVPHVVLVGSDRTALEGDILHVAAPDDYEGLPLKSLKMVEWVCRQTGFGHLLKVDDDCYLDAEAWFLDNTYRRHPYYGRRLDKHDHLIDRAWHQGRSTSPAGRHGFEKLPRRAIYADGGTGYALNRQAMQALLDVRETPRGEALVSAAWSEDKLIGALLAEAGIEPREQGFFTTVNRRAGPECTPVPQWVSGIMPSPLGVTKLAHLDSGGDMRAVHAQKDALRLRPARIWPPHAAPRLGYNSKALHLMSPQARLRAASEAEVAVVSVVRNERAMLPHFLDWYRARGVTGFLIADNGSDDGTLDYLAGEADVALFTADTDFRETDQGTDWKIALMAHYRVDRWSLVADADEFLLYPGYAHTPLPNWLHRYRFAQTDAVRVRMMDLYPEGPLGGATLDAAGPFAAAPFTDRRPFLADSLASGPFGDAVTWTSAVRHRLMPGARPELFVAQKVPLLRYRPWMQLSTSLHYAADATLAPDDLLFAHFKYHAGFAGKAKTEIDRGQYYNDAEEYRRYLSLTKVGHDRLYDPGVSVPWQQSEPARTLLMS